MQLWQLTRDVLGRQVIGNQHRTFDLKIRITVILNVLIGLLMVTAYADLLYLLYEYVIDGNNTCMQKTAYYVGL